jgi:diguanylate cyclase (GGDEF)-like protein
MKPCGRLPGPDSNYENNAKRISKQVIRKLFDFLDGKSKPAVIMISIVIVFLIGVIDYLVLWELYMFVFYLLPVFWVTWHAGKIAGIFLSFISSVTWLAADILSLHSYSHPIIPYWNIIVIFGFFTIITYILHALKKALDHEKDLARTDYLTGVANRRLFFELAEVELNKAHRYLRPITLAYIDLDNFKPINDQMGHNTGDMVLLVVAQTMKNSIRVTDLITRLGGDEFVIMLPETGMSEAKTVIEKIGNNLKEAMRQNRWPVSFSFGVVTFVRPPDSVDIMVQKADELMLEAKQNQKNQVKFKIFPGNIFP